MKRRSVRFTFTLPSAIVFAILTLGPLPSPTVPMPDDPALDPFAPLGTLVEVDRPDGLGRTVRDAP